MSWPHVTSPTPKEYRVDPYKASLEEAAATVKAAARLFGAGSVGIAPMDERYVFLMESGKDVLFQDVDVPKVDDKSLVIPKKMKWVVSIGEAAASLGYSHCTFIVSHLAEFVRGLGYQAIPSVNITAASFRRQRCRNRRAEPHQPHRLPCLWSRNAAMQGVHRHADGVRQAHKSRRGGILQELHGVRGCLPDQSTFVRQVA